MTEKFRTFSRWYGKIVLDHPVWVLICLGILIAILGYKARDFRIDASADALLLENDVDLRYARQVGERYGVHDFLLVSYTPLKGDLLAKENLDALGRLRGRTRGHGLGRFGAHHSGCAAVGKPAHLLCRYLQRNPQFEIADRRIKNWQKSSCGKVHFTATCWSAQTWAPRPSWSISNPIRPTWT